MKKSILYGLKDDWGAAQNCEFFERLKVFSLLAQ